MKDLKQKYHGLPGIGVSGQTGTDGEKAKSIYMNFIHNFFEGDDISVGSYVYAAKRVLQHVNNISTTVDISQLDKETSAAALKLTEAELAIYDSSDLKAGVVNASTDTTSYLNYTEIYYTGSHYNSASAPIIENSITGIDFPTDIDNIKLDINGDLITMSFMLQSAKDVAFNEQFVNYDTTKDEMPGIFNITVTLQNIDYGIGELYNVKNDGRIYTFEDESILRTYVDSTYLPFDTNDAIYQNNPIYGKAVEDGTIISMDTNLTYTVKQPNEESLYKFIKDKDIYNNDYPYILDTNIVEGVLANNELIVQHMADDHLYLTNSDNNFWYYYFKTSLRQDKNSLLYESDMLLSDSDGLIKNSAFFGLTSDDLLDNKGVNADLNSNLYNNINNIVVYDDNYNSEYNITEKEIYYNTIKNASKKTLVELVSKDNGKIYYSLDESETKIFVPKKLDSKYKAGDILYFYTNNFDFNNIDNPLTYNVLKYMVVLTDNLLGCSPAELINAAQLIEPLQIKNVNTINNRIVSYNNIAVVQNDSSNNTNLRLSNKSFIGIADNYSNDLVLIGAKKDNSFNLLSAPVLDMNNYIYCSNTNDSFTINTNKYIKLNNLYINDQNITEKTNIEIYNKLYDSNIKFYDNQFIRPLTDIQILYSINTENTVLFAQEVNGSDYFYNIETLDNYFYGCDIYNENFELVNTITSKTELLNVEILPTIKNKVYYIQMFASHNSIKYYSKISKLSIDYINVSDKELPEEQIMENELGEINRIFKYNNRTRITGFKIEILGEEQSIIKTNLANKIFFDISDISFEKCDSSLFVYSNDPSVKINKVLFNTQPYENEALYVNDWSEIERLNDEWVFNISCSTNLPKYIINTTTYQANSINEYVLNGSDESENESGYESDLFKKLSNGYKLGETNQRSILVTVEYEYDVSTYNKETYYENFKIIQPGFKDTRDIPNIEFKTHNKMSQIQDYNSIEKGVLCNQYVTYMDINIKDFKNKWGKFVNKDTSILLDFDIINIDYDLDWQTNNIVDALSRRSSFKAILENNSESLNNNYIKISVSLDEGKNISVDNLVANRTTLINSALNCGGNVNIKQNFVLFDNNNIEIDTDNGVGINIDNETYIIYDDNFINANSSPEKIYSGLHDYLNISFTDIPVDDIEDQLKLKLLFEFGNPMLANAYFRFSIDNVKIRILNKDSETGEFKDTHVFKTNIPKILNEEYGTYLAYAKTSYDGAQQIKDVHYKFLSDPIDITFTPISYIICPKDKEKTYSNIYGDIYKYGIHEQIFEEIKFYNSSIYESNKFNYSKKEIREKQYYDFNNLNIKLGYLQDNVKDIIVKPISLYDIAKRLNVSKGTTVIDEKLYKQHNILDFLEGEKYLGIIYRSGLLNPKLRDGVYTFMYNDNAYLQSKYNQLGNNMPIFANIEHSLKLRNDDLINAMDKWNDYYITRPKYVTASTYDGILSLYGNGYSQILNNDITDTNIADMDINEVKALNDVDINLLSSTTEVDIIPSRNIDPDNGEYKRGFLYDINWEFPYYDNTGVIPYRIVSPFDNLLKLLLNNSNNLNNSYIDHYNKLVNAEPYGTNMIPYNLLFDISPRVAFNYNTRNINVLMLRRPTIGEDTDNTTIAFDTTYKFTRQLFNLSSDVEKLKSPYTIK